jgi:enoyl-CoA hydratase/carnithine racemase
MISPDAVEEWESSMIFETLKVSSEAAVLFVEIAAPPMNLLGPALVRDLVSLIQRAEANENIKVLVFKSADPDYFIAHVDVTQIKEYRAEAAKLIGEPSIGLMFRYLSASRLVTIAQIEGRVRAAGSEFVLACDMRFAARESAIFSQPEVATGVSPGAGGLQHLARLIGRARALEVMLSAGDYDAELAERYGWINRALPADTLEDFVRSLAHRIANFLPPASSQSRTGSMRSRSRRWRTSGTILISSVRVHKPPKPKADSRPHSSSASRRGMQKWTWPACWAKSPRPADQRSGCHGETRKTQILGRRRK